jgi:hypothetical protein
VYEEASAKARAQSSFTLSLLIFLVLARKEHQNFELLKELQKALISGLIINVKYRSI